MSLGQCGTLQAADRSPPTNVLSHFGLILGPFARYETAAMGCALGHRSSPFRRFGAIFGVPNANRDLYIDLSCQTFHQMPLRRSPVSSRDLASSGLLWHPTKEVQRSGYADIHGSGSALRRHVLRECSGPHCGAVGSARNRPRGRSPRWMRTSAARPQTHGRAIELEGGGGARRAVQSLFTSALEYHAQVPDQRDATLEP